MIISVAYPLPTSWWHMKGLECPEAEVNPMILLLDRR
jgi:hypothetical protein